MRSGFPTSSNTVQFEADVSVFGFVPALQACGLVFQHLTGSDFLRVEELIEAIDAHRGRMRLRITIEVPDG